MSPNAEDLSCLIGQYFVFIFNKFFVLSNKTVNKTRHSECAKLCVILQSFLRDAEQLESLTASHEAFLDFDDLGVSLLF